MCYSGSMGVDEIPIAIVIGTILVGLSFSFFAFRRLTPNAFRCAKCDHEFRRAPYRAYPAACPKCGARDWNVT